LQSEGDHIRGDSKIELLNVDCIQYMSTVNDKAFDLAIVDPPYGINFGMYKRTKASRYKNSMWDKSVPTTNYFDELFRVSKNQIVWGGNYFLDLWKSPCKGFIFWYKQNPVPNFSDGEFAWTSFNRVAQCFNFRYYGGLEGKTLASKKIHPTQKPIDLYKWVLSNYAKDGDKILDTHLGSGSSAIAAYQMGFDFVGCELDKDYFEAAQKRFKEQTAQTSIF
jgi:site-specific DNA-methyltransferase (adenine-specific)